MTVHIQNTDQQIWNTFEQSRDHLFNQFQEISFDSTTGLSLQDLQDEIETYLQAHPDQPRVVQKAHIFRIVVTRGQITIDPRDWFVDKLNHGGHSSTPRAGDESSLVRSISLQWLQEAMTNDIAKESSWLEHAYARGQASGPKAGLDRGHIAPGWDSLLSQGLVGLLDQVTAARQDLGNTVTAEQDAFYSSVEIVYHATIQLSVRFADLAESMIPSHPQHAVRLQAIASCCRNVPAHRPRTFHEALQFIWLMHELIEMEGELVRSMGQFDRSLYPFYRADIEAGRLTPEQAKELIKFFWIKFYSRTRGHLNGKNFVFGGQYPNGTEITNDLTYLALDAYEELNTPDPKLSIRLLPSSPMTLYRRIADLIRKGHNSLVLINDIPAVEALVRRGKTLEDARFYLPIGCYEPAVEGKEAACTMNLTVNLAKGIELVLHNGRDPLSGEQLGPKSGDPRAFTTFEQLWFAYTQQMDFFLEHALSCIQAAERHWPQINPSPLIAGTIKDCIVRGRDVGQGGPIYNSVGFVGAGLANVCDSLLALKQGVFEEHRFSMESILHALSQNFEDHEPMRQYLLNRVPKWGNNHLEADALAKRIAEYYCKKVHSFTNGRGGACQAALFTLDYAWKGGQQVGALPDGRRAYESLAPGMGASYGQDKNGVTALINSVTKLDATLLPNGAVLDITLHPTAVRGAEGQNALIGLIKTFITQGGYAVQFNVYDIKTLREAQIHPENYATLQIRLTGWSVYFTTLSLNEQNQFIARISHGL